MQPDWAELIKLAGVAIATAVVFALVSDESGEGGG